MYIYELYKWNDMIQSNDHWVVDSFFGWEKLAVRLGGKKKVMVGHHGGLPSEVRIS